MISAFAASSDPYHPFQNEGRTARLQLLRRRERREGEPGERDRGVRGSVAAAPWEENAHARDSSREAVEHEDDALTDDPPKRSRTS